MSRELSCTCSTPISGQCCLHLSLPPVKCLWAAVGSWWFVGWVRMSNAYLSWLRQLPWSMQGWSSWRLLELKAPVHMARMVNTVHHRLGHGLQPASFERAPVALCKRLSNCSSKDCSTRIRLASTAACIPLRYLPGQTGRPSLDRAYSPACWLTWSPAIWRDRLAHTFIFTRPCKHSLVLNDILTRAYQCMEIWHIGLLFFVFAPSRTSGEALSVI